MNIKRENLNAKSEILRDFTTNTIHYNPTDNEKGKNTSISVKGEDEGNTYELNYAASEKSYFLESSGTLLPATMLFAATSFMLRKSVRLNWLSQYGQYGTAAVLPSIIILARRQEGLLPTFGIDFRNGKGELIITPKEGYRPYYDLEGKQQKFDLKDKLRFLLRYDQGPLFVAGNITKKSFSDVKGRVNDFT